MTKHIVLDFFLILGVSLWLIELGANGVLSVEHVAFAIVGLAVFAAVTRIMGSGPVKFIFEISIPLAVLLTFVILHGDGNFGSVAALLAYVFVMLIPLFGIYVMIRGVFGRGDKDR
jgi:hypothetical protein